MSTIIPLNQNFPIADPQTGYFTSYFKRFMDQLLARIGGISGGSYTALTNTAGVVVWDLNASPIAVVTLQNGVNTISPPLNQVAGLLYPYRLTVIQPSSGAAGTISWAAAFKWPGGTPWVLSAANGKVDIGLFVSDGTFMYGIVAQDGFA